MPQKENGLPALSLYFTVNGTVTECWRLPDVAVTVTVYVAGFVVEAVEAEL